MKDLEFDLQKVLCDTSAKAASSFGNSLKDLARQSADFNALSFKNEGSRGGGDRQSAGVGSNKDGTNSSKRESANSKNLLAPPGRREVEKLRNKLVMSNRECEHLK